MTVVDGYNQLLEIPASVCLWKASLPNHQLKHVTPCCILHGNCQILMRQEYLCHSLLRLLVVIGRSGAAQECGASITSLSSIMCG